MRFEPVASTLGSVERLRSSHRHQASETSQFWRNRLINNRSYATAKPYPHAVLDNFLPTEVAEAAVESFPSPTDPMWLNHGREYVNPSNGRKLEMAKYEFMPAALKAIVDIVHSEGFVRGLCEMTGFDDLIADPTLMGGGLNLGDSGAFLRTHADFNYNNELAAYRTVNLLIYFNKDWQEDWGGALELWERDMSQCVQAILPLFNRAVVFTTYNDAYHGYPAIRAPKGFGRKSMNFYFYRKQAAPGIDAKPHATLWQGSKS